MHEQDFKQALRDSMAVVTAPPPMNESEVLDAAKRAVRRRRAMWASGASVVGVVALAAGVAFAAPGADRSAERVGAEVTSTKPPQSDSTEPDYPDGMTDATASSGPHYEQGVTLLNELIEVVPAGFDAPDLKGQPGNGLAGTPLRWHQATWGNGDSWNYVATIPVAKADQVGGLGASVFIAGKGAAGPKETPCELTFYDVEDESSSCQEVTVAGKRIGVVTRLDRMRATYRHPDGTEVTVSQSVGVTDYGYPALSELPFTAQQLAELATDRRFHLD